MWETTDLKYSCIYSECADTALGLWGAWLAGGFIWLMTPTVSWQDKHIEEVRKNKESKDPADETEAD